MNRVLRLLEEFETLPWSPLPFALLAASLDLHYLVFLHLLPVLSNRQNSRHITASITIIGSRPNRDQVFVRKMVLLPFHHQLMRPRDEIQPIHVRKFIRHPRPEEIPSISRTDLPRRRYESILRVRPHQVAERTLDGYFLLSIDGANLIYGTDIGAQSTVDAKDAPVDDRPNAKGVEAIDAVSPRGCVAILSVAFVVKAVDLSDLAGFVIAPEQGDVSRKFQLEAEKEAQRFDGIVSPINEIAQEDI